jgi:hypothetical protein
MGVPKLTLDLIGKILDQIHPKLSLPTREFSVSHSVNSS